MLLRFQKAAVRGNYETGSLAFSMRLRFLTIRASISFPANASATVSRASALISSRTPSQSRRLNRSTAETSLTRRVSTQAARAKNSWVSHQWPSRQCRSRDRILQRFARQRSQCGGQHRKSMMQAVEASLKRLQTDYIHILHGAIRPPCFLRDGEPK